jgi:hypothetical protein
MNPMTSMASMSKNLHNYNLNLVLALTRYFSVVLAINSHHHYQSLGERNTCGILSNTTIMSDINKSLVIEYFYEMEYVAEDPYKIIRKVKRSIGNSIAVSTFPNCESKNVD